ncbi:hypothetical protein L210DRAFT_3643546 [Boletus edulis BED1]|uniref:Uncharacterized protein n=1 Tax=Boletus edulis BED1 TaxID=1328754 RepID=A0AAD4C0B0_BOLED|nr:hypothetical protein L210DRAFT_3643546 [Boletus edulis BED1]
MSRSLASFPEELLVRILSLSLVPPHRTPSDGFPPLPHRNRVAPLLVSRQFFRIAVPLFYHTLHLHSPRQTARVLDTLTHHPTLAHAVRRVVFPAICHASAAVLSLCDRVYDVDICLDCGPGRRTSGPDPDDVDAEAFCYALEQRRTIAHLTIRKDPAAYLTHSRPMYVLQRLAQAVRHWTNLETVHFALRLSASPTTLPLARALSVAPRLRYVRAQLPAVWNNFLLLISTNQRLEKVILYAEPILGPIQGRSNLTMGSAVIKGGYICDDIEHAVLGTGLYMMEAKKHARFSELIRSGTSIIRTRAHTTIVTLSTPSAGRAPLGAIRAKELAAELMDRDSFGSALTRPLAVTTVRHAHAQLV